MMKKKKKTEKMHQNQNWKSWIAIFIWLRTREIEKPRDEQGTNSGVLFKSQFFLLWHNRTE